MTAKRSHPRIPVLLRLEPEELALIDRCRTIMNRSDFIREAIAQRCAVLDYVSDVLIYGRGYLKDGKHIPIAEVEDIPEPRWPLPADGP